MSILGGFSGADVNMSDRFHSFKSPHEVLDVIIDEWCDGQRETRPVPVTKLELKNELGRAVGLGNGDDCNTAAKADPYRTVPERKTGSIFQSNADR